MLSQKEESFFHVPIVVKRVHEDVIHRLQFCFILDGYQIGFVVLFNGFENGNLQRVQIRMGIISWNYGKLSAAVVFQCG